MKPSLLFPVAAAVLVSCATSSGPVSLGADSYMIARTKKSFRGSAAPVRAVAIKEASDFCARQGKVMVLTKTVQKDMRPFQNDACAEVYFRAVSPADPITTNPPPIQEIRE